MIDFDACIEQGLLRRVPASREKARRSIEKARELFLEAKADLRDGRINSTVIVSYTAIFHAARALLFKDGFREKSHECVIRYLEEKYVKTKQLGRESVELLDKYKSERMRTQYDISYSPTEEDAERMAKFAEEFIGEIESVVG